jgi:hypothetical protein
LGTKKFKQKNCTISKIKNWKKRFGKPKKMKNKIELFGHQKVQKVQIFWVTKKN